MYDRKTVWVALAHQFVGFNMLYFSMLILGMLGMPRRYYDYLPRFQPLHLVATVGSWILVAGLVIMAVALLRALKKGERAPANPWGGVSLEWTVPSPPPAENFPSPPVVGEPYDFSKGPAR
jgi:cytochrome c oxidase subunit 1